MTEEHPAPPRVSSPNEWTPATVVGLRSEGAGTRTLSLEALALPSTVAGQHIDIRLTAEDGYTAQRSYSLASPAGAMPLEVTVDRLPDGEVSPYLVDGVEVGDRLEVRGPIGRWFVWRPEQEEPVTLVAGGSGLVPLMSIIRTRRASDSTAPFRLIVSTRTPDRDLYRAELDEIAATGPWLTVTHLYTRRAPSGDRRGAHRITAGDIETLCFIPDLSPSVYVCGPTPFVEAVTDLVTEGGHDASRIRAERFGASS